MTPIEPTTALCVTNNFSAAEAMGRPVLGGEDVDVVAERVGRERRHAAELPASEHPDHRAGSLATGGDGEDVLLDDARVEQQGADHRRIGVGAQGRDDPPAGEARQGGPLADRHLPHPEGEEPIGRPPQPGGESHGVEQLRGRPVPAAPGREPLVELHRPRLLEEVDDGVAVGAEGHRTAGGVNERV